jgi:hypothetical protein
MKQSAEDLWDAWQRDPEIRELAEAWITKRSGDWTSDDEDFYGVMHSDPDRGLAIIFGMMQLAEDPKMHGAIAAGPVEDFLGVFGERYLEVFHTLALQHRRLREVLDGVWQGAMPKGVWHKIEILKQRAFS